MSNSRYLIIDWVFVHRKEKKKKEKSGEQGGRLHRKGMCKSAAAFNLLEVETIMLVQYQLYSILTELLQLWIAFALKPIQNAMFVLEKAKSVQKSVVLCLLGRWEAEAADNLWLPGCGGKSLEMKNNNNEKQNCRLFKSKQV